VVSLDGEEAKWLHDIVHSSFIFPIVFVHLPFFEFTGFSSAVIVLQADI